MRLWDTFTRRLVGEPLTDHKDWVQGLAFSPDRALIATWDSDETVRLWRTTTRQRVGGTIPAGAGARPRTRGYGPGPGSQD
ncbi:WD40 repeat domain-containing protein, partial [Streptomyces sp. NPDC058424]|uniref:WD40 repeat domain-containing protein n=1 Tax=Streptomyces sp. NPDC058424 TaxID=3346491 RepID=UPI003650CCBA